MIALLLGAVTLLVLMSALGMFSRATVATIKSFGIWVAGIGALLMAAMLFLTGRLPAALGILAVAGPLIWSFRGEAGLRARPRSRASPRANPRANPGASPGAGPRMGPRPGAPPPRRSGAMTRVEAFAVLGLPPTADRDAIQAAYLRLMRAAHPDRGGSDWLAARINQARDTLVG